MRSSHRAVVLACGLALGLASAAWGQGEFTLGPPKERPVAPVKEGSVAPAREQPAPPAGVDSKPGAPAPRDSADKAEAERCQPLKSDEAGQLAVKAGDALENRRFHPAKKLIADALRLEPEAGELRLGMAAAMARLGELEGTAREYEAFLEACPKHAKAATVRRLLEEYRHTKGAQAFASPVVDELARSVFAKEEEGEALCDESQLPPEARTVYDEGVRLLNSGKSSRAVTAFKRVLELEPRSVMARLMLGSAYSQMNVADEAAQAYMTFLVLCPQHPRAAEVRQLIQASGMDAL
jgi:Flp pilus assembly protein TadD